MLARVAGDRTLTTPGFVVARVCLSLFVWASTALAIEIGLSHAYFLRLSHRVGVVAIVEMPPGDYQRIGVVHGDDPTRKPRTAEIPHLSHILKYGTVLGKIRHQVIVNAYPDVVTNSPSIRVEESVLGIVVLDHRELCIDLAELWARNPCVKKWNVKWVHRVFTHLLPIAG